MLGTPVVPRRREEEQDLLSQIGGLLGGAAEGVGGVAKGIGEFAQQNPELTGILGGLLTGGQVGEGTLGAIGGLFGGAQQRQEQAAATKAATKAAELEQKKVIRSQENILRKELGQKTKTFDKVLSAQKKVESSLSQATAAGDFAGIFAFMKVLDPGSTVREGEFASAENSTGVPARVRNLYNKALEGQRLNPVQREDFLRTSRNLFESERQVFDQSNVQFAQLAQRQGLDVKNVVIQKQAILPNINDILQKTTKAEDRIEKSESKSRPSVFGLTPSDEEPIRKVGRADLR